MKNLTTRSIIKGVARGVVGAGVGMIMDDVIANNTAPPTILRKKFAYKVGAAALGGMVSNASKDYIGSIVDDTFALFDGMVTIVQAVQNESSASNIQFNAETDIQGEVVDQPTTQA